MSLPLSLRWLSPDSGSLQHDTGWGLRIWHSPLLVVFTDSETGEHPLGFPLKQPLTAHALSWWSRWNYSPPPLTEGQKRFSVGEGQKRIDIIGPYCPPKTKKTKPVIQYLLRLKIAVGGLEGWLRERSKKTSKGIDKWQKWTDTVHEDPEICLKWNSAAGAW